QSTELIQAQQDGTEATVKAAQAYDNAIHSGASGTKAAAVAAATLENELARAAVAAAALDKQMQAESIAAMKAAGGMFGGGAGRQLAFGGSNLAAAGGSVLTFPGDPNYFQYNYGQQGDTTRRISPTAGYFTQQAIQAATATREAANTQFDAMKQATTDAMKAMENAATDNLSAMLKSTTDAMGAIKQATEAMASAAADVMFNPSTGPNAKQIDA